MRGKWARGSHNAGVRLGVPGAIAAGTVGVLTLAGCGLTAATSNDGGKGVARLVEATATPSQSPTPDQAQEPPPAPTASLNPTPTQQPDTTVMRVEPATAAANQPKPNGRTLTITGSGDILIHPSIADQADANGSKKNPDFRPMLADVKSRISSADFSICHVETPFSQPGVRTAFPHYYVHPNLAKAIAWTGFDDCSTASNWTFDKGMDGIHRTIDSLKQAGVGQAGSLENATDSRIHIRTIRGIKIAHLSYTDPYDSPTVPGSEWAVNRQDPEQIAQDAHTARELGAQIVIVSYADGDMGATDWSAQQEQAINTITAGGDVDYVIGHGSHTVQPAKKVNGTWVVWHGNLLASFFPDEKTMLTGLISEATFQQSQQKGRFVLTSIEGIAVESVDGSIRTMDLASHNCADAKRYQAGWDMVHNAEATAISEGMKFPAICSEH